MPAPPTALAASGLVKRYGSTVALDGVELRVATGSVHGLLGPNGAGKTTLLRIIFGLVRPDAGEVRLYGRRVTAGRTDPDIAGFVESPRFYPHLTGRRNLRMLAAYDQLDEPADIDGALDQVGLAEQADRRVSGYSSGMRQRLGVAAALLRRAKLLVFDEPTNGLDPAGIRDLRALVAELAGSGRTVVFSSHRMDEVEALCDDVTILKRGEVAYAGTLERLRAQAPAPEHRLHTADDPKATAVAAGHGAIAVGPRQAGGLVVRARQEDLDEYVMSLGREGVAVRELHRTVTPLEQMFFSLTETLPPPSPSGPPPSTTFTGDGDPVGEVVAAGDRWETVSR
jgi:ABC-2 type transport system ATP-binding protein